MVKQIMYCLIADNEEGGMKKEEFNFDVVSDRFDGFA